MRPCRGVLRGKKGKGRRAEPPPNRGTTIRPIENETGAGPEAGAGPATEGGATLRPSGFGETLL